MLKRFLYALLRFAGRTVYRLYLGLGALLVAVIILFTAFPQLPTAFHTALFVLQVLNVPVKPQPWFTPTPVRQQITYQRPDQQGEADIYYIPDGKRRAALMVFLGANAAGRDDRDVVNFGNALARAGYVTMFCWSPTMGQQNNVDPAETENLTWAFQHLRELKYVDQSRVGMAGFSVGGSFVMVAASDPRIRDDVAFLNSFGAYYDAHDFFIQIASNSRISQGKAEPWAVDLLTRRVFTNEMLELVTDPQERELLERRFLREEPAVNEESPQLSEQAEIARQLLEGATPEQAANLLAQLPADFRRKLEEISPSNHLGQVKAKLLIMHDVGDSLIPVEESRRLVATLREENRRDLRYTETEIFEHVRPGSSLRPWALAKGASKLYLHMYGILRLAA